jgi:hypothetical protein
MPLLLLKLLLTLLLPRKFWQMPPLLKLLPKLRLLQK